MKYSAIIQRLTIALLLLFSTGACGPKITKPRWDSAVSANPRVEAAFREARDLFSKGKLGEADEKFSRIIDRYPRDPLSRVSKVFRARIALEMDNPKRARQLLSPLIAEDDPVADRAKLYDGVALHRQGSFEAAAQVLRPLQNKMTDPDENTLLLRTLWKASKNTGKIEDAVETIDRLLAQSVNENARAEATDALKEMVAAINEVAPLQKMAAGLPDENSAWPILMARIAEIHLEAGRFKASAEVLEAIEAKKRLQESTVQEIAEEVANRTNVNMNAVGLLVPLSGRSRLVGDSVVKGAMIAATETGANVVIRDTKSNPQQTAQMVAELIEKENVFAIAGPLDGAAAEAAAEKAEELRTPILLLTIKEDLSAVGGYVFRDFPSNRAEISALLKTAELAGHKRLGVLYPENAFGKTLYNLAADEVEKTELTIVADASYDANSTVFQLPADKMAAAAPEVLLLLDTPSRVALLAPALAAAGLWSVHPGDLPGGPGEPVQLLIPSFGFSSDLVRRAGRYLNGAIFTLFYEPSVTPNSEDFARRYHIDYGKQANYLAAFGHDAIILLSAAAKSNLQGRDEVRAWLLSEAAKNITRLNTATPFAGFSATGDSVAAPWIIELRDGEFIEIVP